MYLLLSFSYISLSISSLRPFLFLKWVMVTFHFSFHFNVLFCAFPFFCRRRRGTCLLTYCTVLRRQLFSINLQLLNIFYKGLSCCFSFPSFVLSIYIYMHTNNTVEIRTVLLLVNVSMQQPTFISSLGLSQFYATCRAKWDTPGLELFFARVGLLPNLPHNRDLQ